MASDCEVLLELHREVDTVFRGTALGFLRAFPPPVVRHSGSGSVSEDADLVLTSLESKQFQSLRDRVGEAYAQASTLATHTVV